MAGFYPYRLFWAYQHNEIFMTDDGWGVLAGHSFASWEASGVGAECRVIEITFHYLQMQSPYCPIGNNIICRCSHHIAQSETIVMFQPCAHDFAPFNRLQIHACGDMDPFETPA